MFAECDDIAENVDAYLIGALDDDESQMLEEHVSGCIACRRRLEITGATSPALALGVPMVAPGAAVKARVMAGALALRSAKRHREWGWRLTAVAASVALVAVGALAWAALLQNQRNVLPGRNSAFVNGINAEQTAIAPGDGQAANPTALASNLSGLLAFNDARLDLSTAADVRDTRLVGTAIAPAATGQYVWSQLRGLGALEVRQLPTLPDGMIYEMRIEYPSGTVTGGRFTVDRGGRATLLVHDTDPSDDSQPARGFVVDMTPLISSDAAGGTAVLTSG